MPNPTDVLLAYSKKQATADEVMRALVEHDDWCLPVHALTSNKVDGRVVIYAQNYSVRQDRLLVFTNREAMDAAAAKIGNEAMGVYGGGVKGVDLFGSLLRKELEACKELIVDGASGQERMWWVPRDSFVLCNSWSEAVKLERTLKSLDDNLFPALSGYQAWWVPVAKSDTSLVHVPVDGVPHGFAFTAPDHYDRFLKQVGAQADQVKSLVVPSARLFPFFMQTQLGGMLLNGTPFNRKALELVIKPIEES
ncbi:MAG: hypothetical protein ACO1OB_23200 [Archangium sp.]